MVCDRGRRRADARLPRVRRRRSSSRRKWTKAGVPLTNWAGQTIRIVFTATDGGPDSLVEAGVDDVRGSRLPVASRAPPMRGGTSSQTSRRQGRQPLGPHQVPTQPRRPIRSAIDRCGDSASFSRPTLLGLLLTAGSDPRLRRAHRPERRGQPAPDDDVRRLPRRRGALRHGLPVRRRRRRVRLDHAAARRPVERREGRRLDAPAADPRDRARSVALRVRRRRALPAAPAPRSS